MVDKTSIIDGKTIQPNDLILGLASSGLHTNGYSLARKLLFEIAGFKIHQYIDELQTNAADVLLVPHKNYNLPVHALLKQSVPIHGMAHITGGGLLGNIPRILPANTSALINKKSLIPPALFQLLQNIGHLTTEESYKTFNMGIGFILVIPEFYLTKIETIMTQFSDYPISVIGEIISGKQEVILT